MRAERSYFSSKTFDLIAQGGQRFIVHGAILAAQSEPFRKATTGPWSESQERIIDLQEWDGPTVERLVSFLYRNDYQILSTEPPSEFLTSHAKVYALAQYKDIKALKELALRRLNSGLASLRKDTMKLVDIVGLFEYVYSHTDSLANSKEPMRELVAEFASLNFQTLQTEEMRKLVGEQSDFRNDLMARLCFRLDCVEKLEDLLNWEKARGRLIQRKLDLTLAEMESLKMKVRMYEDAMVHEQRRSKAESSRPTKRVRTD